MRRAFPYHRAVAPIVWAFLCVASAELVVTHLMVALWRPWGAVALSAVTLPGVVWLALLLRSLKRLPVVIEGDRLIMRVGTLKRIDLARADVRGLRDHWTADTFKRGDVLKLSLLAWPNVMIDLTAPVPGRRGPVLAVAHRLDDPGAFAAALHAWLAEPSPCA